MDKNETEIAVHLLSTKVSSRFKNEWDELHICDTCRVELASLPDDDPIAESTERVAAGEQYLYFIGATEGPIKIGITSNLANRLAALQTGFPYALSVLASVRGDATLERAYHQRFAATRLHG